MATVDSRPTVSGGRVDLRRPRYRRALARITSQPRGILVGTAVLVAVPLLGWLLPWITGYAPHEFVDVPLLAPSLAHPFGTDEYGRDVMVRAFAASHVDYLIAAVTVGVSALVGSAVGVFSACVRARGVDWIIMRLADAVISFPLLVLVLALVVVFGDDLSLPGVPQGMPALLAALVAIGWAYYARLARSQAVSLRSREFVVAAQQMGYSDLRIAVRHLLPTVMTVTLAYSVGDAITAVAIASSLSFFGAGVAPPTPEWGQMMYEGRGLIDSAWWITTFPGLIVVSMGLALSLAADGLAARLGGRQ